MLAALLLNEPVAGSARDLQELYYEWVESIRRQKGKAVTQVMDVVPVRTLALKKILQIPHERDDNDALALILLSLIR